MNSKGSVIQRLEALWRECLLKRGNDERVKRGLAWENWEGLGNEAVGLATKELRRRRWRGARGGVVPRGYDAESVAAEAIRALFAGEARLALGWTRERLVKEMERLISNKVRVLWGLKETSAVRSEWEVLPHKANGKAVSIISLKASEGRNGYEAAVEAEEGRDSVRRRIEALLKNEPELRAVFVCLWEGERRNREIARRVGITEKEAVLARKRLSRRLKRARLKLDGI